MSALLFPTLLLGTLSFQVEGTTCFHEEALAAMTANPVEGRLRVQPAGAGLAVTWYGVTGAVLGQRTLPPFGSCEELRALVAAVLEIWSMRLGEGALGTRPTPPKPRRRGARPPQGHTTQEPPREETGPPPEPPLPPLEPIAAGPSPSSSLAAPLPFWTKVRRVHPPPPALTATPIEDPSRAPRWIAGSLGAGAIAGALAVNLTSDDPALNDPTALIPVLLYCAGALLLTGAVVAP